MSEYQKSKGKGPGATNKKGGQSGNGKNKKKKERTANARPYAKEIAYCQAVQSMCGGYYKVKIIAPLSTARVLIWFPFSTFVNESTCLLRVDIILLLTLSLQMFFYEEGET